ncbi:MAG: RagB/SusD family nutrient uptake outer membrane protein [Lewinellaceae bacterium]|nr:RagB/SusD family nutrient uptake outer membrane protein [Saprospiraceae bacterium]MCB9340515.1 RagB/SusD family nutrient uptake outer membrane protein [Lewinellaceae bacterium]
MKFRKYSLFLLLAGTFSLLPSCFNDLDTVPLDKDEAVSEVIYSNPENYKKVLAKIYAGLSTTGQQGPAGQADISGIDEGFGQYIRALWYHQELTTDEAVIAWNDQTIKDFHEQDWSSNDNFIFAMYSRIFYQVSICNEFLRETTEAKLDSRNITGDIRKEIATYRAEARFMRALSYWHAMDLFANPPFYTDAESVGSGNPRQTNRQELFTFLESELKDIEGSLAPPRNEYGRADQAAAWMLLAKLYINAKVYIGVEKNTECIEYCNKVIGAGYSLEPVYQHNFTADNWKSRENIFSAVYDGINIQTYGGTTFIIHAAIGGDMAPTDYGFNGGWGGTRTTSTFVDKFSPNDGRAMFYEQGQTKEIEDISLFNNGYAITKFTNLNSDGSNGSDREFADTDFPIFRLADAYLMYAEAVLRGGSGGDVNTAVGYINQLRERAYNGTSGNITSGDLTLDFILDERARELYWECHRRTDLIRFGYFSNSPYLWDWKGGVPEGIATDSKYDIFPIPAADRAANPNLQQNDGY